MRDPLSSLAFSHHGFRLCMQPHLLIISLISCLSHPNMWFCPHIPTIPFSPLTHKVGPIYPRKSPTLGPRPFALSGNNVRLFPHCQRRRQHVWLFGDAIIPDPNPISTFDDFVFSTSCFQTSPARSQSFQITSLSFGLVRFCLLFLYLVNFQSSWNYYLLRYFFLFLFPIFLSVALSLMGFQHFTYYYFFYWLDGILKTRSLSFLFNPCDTIFFFLFPFWFRTYFIYGSTVFLLV